ncbi:acyltransferase [Serratia marcescens]|nr:acyltransferase [Serratia marcescens]MBN5276104.1 acyltransferase [Serratia marcescens]MBN5306526.1 acyltransferase [Serratia marcescens]MBN5364932.1 acyltransferase [Serratia marcescens]MBN5420351.1 acyltransferase [Serratia marcescens]
MTEKFFTHDQVVTMQVDERAKTTAGNKSPVRLDYVDSIRGIAAISVVIAHFLVPVYGYDKFIFSHVFDIGKIGVVLFFIISGFIIPSSFRRENGGVQAFFISRLFRLYPGYWFSLLLYLIVSYSLGQQFPLHQILANVTMFQTALRVRDIVGVYWTLFIELVFYFMCVCAFILGLLNKVRFNFIVSFVMLGIAIILAIARSKLDEAFPVALPLALSLMMFGGMWRSFLLDGDLVARKLSVYYIAVFACIIPIVSFFSYGSEPGHTMRYTITYYVSMLLFVLLTTRLRIHNKFMVMMGVISYSVYLIHPSLLIVYEHFTADFSSANRYLLGVIGVLLTLPASYLVYRFIELPSINLGRRVKSSIIKVVPQ